MAFSTWSELAQKMCNDLAQGNWRTKPYNFGGMKEKFFTPEEFLTMLEYVERRASGEGEGYPLRTSAAGTNR